MSEIAIYETDSGVIQVTLEQETVWLSQAQMAELFGTKRPAITKHLSNIFSSGELSKDSVCSILEHTASDGKRYKSQFYNLDAIISVGYRVNSVNATRFRVWANRILKEYLVKGYSINRDRFEQNAIELEQALKLIQKAAKSPELSTDSGRGLVEIVSRYTQTFIWLQRYDEGLLNEPEGQAGGALPSEQEAKQALVELKISLIQRGEATELFANEHSDGLSSILGNLDQTVLGKPAYASVESKAAHLLYFVVKNHPFTDGNKRCGAFLFVDFLHRNNRLFNAQGQPLVNDTGLAALTLLVAESDPKQKEILIRLIMNMLVGDSR